MARSDATSRSSTSPAKVGAAAGTNAGGEPSDGDLIRRCRAGDQQAWTLLIQRYERLVYSVPRRLGVSSDITDETFQEVWAVLLRRLPSLQHEQALPQWLITTARRVALRAAQRARQRGGTADANADAELTSVVDRPEGEFIDRMERAHQVTEALDRLDPGCRELLVALTRSDHASYAELSRQLNMPIGSIGPKRARCLEKLTQLLPASLRAAYGQADQDAEDGGEA